METALPSASFVPHTHEKLGYTFTLRLLLLLYSYCHTHTTLMY